METSPPDVHPFRRPADGGALARYWDRMGGGSLTVSLLMHGFFAILALMLIWRTQQSLPAVPGGFTSGGGGGSQGETKARQLQMKMRVGHAPAMRLAAAAPAAVSLPDAVAAAMPVNHLAAASGQMSGTPGRGGGFGACCGSGRNGGEGPGDGPGSLRGLTPAFLGLLSSGDNIIFCIDTSGSMRTNLKAGGIAAVRRELKRVITGLPEKSRFNLICFGISGDLFKDVSVPATAANKQEAIRFLEGYYGGAAFGRTRTETFGRAGVDGEGISYRPLLPADVKELEGTEGGSRIDLAMVAAFERKPSTIYVLSDGAPGTRIPGADGPMDKGLLIDLIHSKYRVLMGPAAPLNVNTISIHTGDAEGEEGRIFLASLARRFGGKHVSLKPDKLQ